MKKNFTRLISRTDDVRQNLITLLTLFLLFALLLVGQAVSAQTTEPFRDEFSNSTQTTLGSYTRGNASITGGELQIIGLQGSTKGYEGYVVTTNSLTFYPGINYTISIRARAVDGNGRLEITSGSTPTAAGAASGNRILTSVTDNVTSTAFQTVSTAFTVTTAQTLFIGLYTQSTGNGADLYLDDFVITATCSSINLTISNPTAVCSPSSVDITSANVTAGSTSGLTFTYWTDAAATVPLNNPSALTASGTYYIKATRAPGCFVVQPVTVTIHTTPTASITTSTPTTFCTGGSVTLTAVANPASPASGNYTYQWRNNGTDIPTATGATYSATTSGNYSVVITSPQGNCPSAPSAPVTVTVLPQPSALVDGGPQILCVGANNTTTFTVSGTFGNGTAEWTSSNPAFEIQDPVYDSATGQATATVVATGTGNATITLSTSNTNASCNTASSNVVLTVNPLPIATITESGPTTFCDGGSVTLTANVGSSYLWSTGATTRAITVTESGSYSVQVTDANTCTSNPSESVEVIVNPVPATPATAGGEVCGQGEVTLTATVGQNGTVVRWYTAATGGTPVATGNSYTRPSLSATTEYYASSFNESTGCESERVAITATVNPLPVATITASGLTTFCQGGSVTLTASAGASWLWSNGATTQSINVTSSGSFSVVVTDAKGCQSVESAATIVTVNPLPIATITPDGPTTFCQGGSVTLTASGGSSYLWSNGATTPSIAVTASGNYTVQVTDGNSCTSAPSAPVTVTVNPLPTVTITPTGPLEFCQGNSVVLVPTALPDTDDFTYKWFDATDDTEVSDEENYVATASGSYYLVVTNQNGCQQTSQTLTVIVTEEVDQAVVTIAGSTTFCQGGSVTLNANKAPSGQVYTYQWLKDGAEIAGATLASLVVTDAGNYQVMVNKADEVCPAKVSAGITITVLPQPVATITSSNEEKCLENTTTFSVTGDFSGGTAQWLSSNSAFVISDPVYNATTGKATATVTATGAGSTTITLRTTNSAASCTPATSSVTLKVNLLPSTTITAGGVTTFCQGGSVVLNAPAGTDYTYQWFRNGTEITSNGTSQQYTATETGNYTVQVTNSVTGCFDTTPSATVVTVNPQPAAAITGSDQAKCIGVGNSTSFTVSGTFSGGTAQWVSSNNSFQIQNAAYNTTTGQATATVVATGTGTSTITLRTTNATSACNTAESTITLTVNPLPSATITAGGPTTFCQGGSVVLSAPQGNYSYQWFRGGTAVTTGGNAKDYTASTAGNYTVRVTDNSTQCEATTTSATTVTVNAQPVVSAASASPAAKCVGSGNLTVFDLTGSVANGTPLWTVVPGSQTGSADVTSISNPNTTGTQVTVSGIGTVTMRLSSSSTVASCTTASREVTLTVHPMPIANAGADQSVCQAASGVTFIWRDGSGSGTGSNTSLDIDWVVKSKDATISSVSIGYPWEYKQRVDITGYGNVTLIMTVTTNGCSTSDDVTYTIKPRPVITAVENKTYCNGQSVGTIALGSDITNAAITWTSSRNIGFGTSGTGNIPAFTAANTGTSTLTATVTMNTTLDGCAATQKSFTITVHPTPKLTNIPATTPQICSESVFNYNPAVSPSGSTTSWSRAAVAGISNAAASGTGSISETLINTTTTAKTVNYIYTVTANGCPNTQTVSVIVNPKPTITTFSLGTDSDGDGNNVFGDVYSGQGVLALTGNPTGGTFRVNGVVRTSFDPCVAGAGTHTITYTLTTAAGCTTVMTKTVKVIQTTYRAVITANPHPFCRGGGGTTYTTAVYRDVQPGEIIYPYLVDANGNPVDENGVAIPKGGGSYPVYNPNYPFPDNTPQSIKEMAYRFFQPVVSDALASRKINQSLFDYQWGKNDEVNRKNDEYITKDAGLSSQDYYEVEVSSSSLCGLVTLESNRMYSAVLENYVITLTASPNPICQGATVTFNGALGAGFPWAIANLQLKVVLVRTGAVLYESGYTGPTFQFTSTAPFIDGDRVEVQFTSNITGYLPSSNCIEGPSANSVTISVNDIVAGTPTDQSKSICLNDNASFTAPATTTGPGTVTYTWTVGSKTYTTSGPNLNIPAEIRSVAGTYPVSVVVSNGCETTSTLALGTLTVKPALTVFNVSGNASFCQGATTGTLPVTLSGSQTGVEYILLRGSTVVETKAGTGSALVFNVPKTVATYTVRAAYATAPPCTTNMNGNAVITQDPLPTVTVNSPSACAGQSATVTAVPSGGSGTGYTYTWTVPTGWSGNAPTTASFTTTVAGIYTVRVTDSKSCVSSAAVTSTVTINPLPTVTVNSPTTCEGTATTVSATVANGTGPYTYEWTGPSGFSNPGNEASFQTAIPGTYSVIVTDSKGCASASGSGTVTVTPTKVAAGIISSENANGPISADNPIKINEPVTFKVTTDIPDADVRLYTWYVGSFESDEWGESVASGTNAKSYTMTPTTDDPFDVRVEITTAAEACYSFTEFFTEDPITPLPVEMLYFRAEKQNNQVVLTWATANEQNNVGFEVQVSQDGKNYRQIQFVPTKNGNTSVKQIYEFVDDENGKYGIRYYRLRQLDSDGKYAYYGPRTVRFDEVSNSVMAYPNPFVREVKLDIESETGGTMEIEVVNMIGRKLMRKQLDVEKGRSTATLDLGEQLPPGVYIITTRINGVTTSYKLLKN